MNIASFRSSFRLAIDSSVAGLPLVPAMNCVPHFVWNGVLLASGLGGSHPCLTLLCIFSNHSVFSCVFQELIAKRKVSGHKTGGDKEEIGWKALRLQQRCNKAVVKTEMREAQLNRSVPRPHCLETV